MYVHYKMMTTPPPPLTPDPGTLVHPNHAHRLPALEEIFKEVTTFIRLVESQPYHHIL